MAENLADFASVEYGLCVDISAAETFKSRYQIICSRVYERCLIEFEFHISLLLMEFRTELTCYIADAVAAHADV